MTRVLFKCRVVLSSLFYFRKVLVVLLTSLLVGCASQIAQLPKTADISVPEQWQSATQANDKNREQNKVQNNWLSSFEDPELDSYVSKALENNPNLLASAAQLQVAFAQVRVTGANLWPNLSVGVNKSKTEITTGEVDVQTQTVGASLDIGWEVDIWGKLSQRKKSALFSAQAQAATYKAAQLSLVANVSRAWFNLITAKLQLDLNHQQLDSFKDTNALIEENYQRGLRSALDVYSSRTNVQLQLAQVSDSEFQYIQTLRAFKTLMGEYPDDSLAFKADLPILSDAVTAGLPANLLTRRPDVQASQLQYQAQIANAKASHRDRFPSIRFTGSIGDNRDEFDLLFKNNNMLWSLVGGITQPVFRAGALKALSQQAFYQAQASYANLVQTTLTAYREVENALSQQTFLMKQHKAVLSAVEYAQNGLELALDRYESGIENYNTVLQSQRRLFDSQRTEINLRNAILQNRIAIHLALGGDFSQANVDDDNS